MPSIAGFIQSLLSEDMYATGMIAQMDRRIGDLNTGQLRLLVKYCETKIPSLNNKTILDAYGKLLNKATAEADRRHEEEVRGERERLRQLKAAHAGVNAKAWDTSHASLDRELAKFQKFLKAKARRVGEKEVIQEEMEKLHVQLMAVPARRVAADNRRHFWWAIGGTLVVLVSPLLLLCLLPVGVWPAVGALACALLCAALCGFAGVVRGVVVPPSLDDDAIEEQIRTRAKEKLREYRAEVRRNYEEFEQSFAADMEWRDQWGLDRKRERRKERKAATSTGTSTTTQPKWAKAESRISPGEEEDSDPVGNVGDEPAVIPRATDEEEGRTGFAGHFASSGEPAGTTFEPACHPAEDNAAACTEAQQQTDANKLRHAASSDHSRVDDVFSQKEHKGICPHHKRVPCSEGFGVDGCERTVAEDEREANYGREAKCP